MAMYNLTIKNKLLIVFQKGMLIDLSFKFIDINLAYLLLMYQYIKTKYLYTLRSVGCETNLT